MSHYQKGTTILSLMIGLLISMLCLTALLALFRAVIWNSAEAQQNSQSDTQLLSGLTVIPNYAQNAGYGLSSAGANPNISQVTVTSGNSATYASAKVGTNAVVWRYKEGTTVTCQGIVTIEDTTNNKTSIALVKLVDTTRCPETDALTSISTTTWTQDRVLATVSGTPTTSFTVADATCSPYGASTAAAHKKLTVTVGSFSFPACLVNT